MGPAGGGVLFEVRLGLRVSQYELAASRHQTTY